MSPNIVLITTDQHRADYVGWHPQSRMRLPNLDRLAEGSVFLNAVSPCPVCQPTRSALLCGKYPRQLGVLAMSGDLSPQHPTFAGALQQAGYHTAMIGKTHWLQTWQWGTPAGAGVDMLAIEDELKAFGFDELWDSAGKQLCLRDRCHYTKHLQDRGFFEAYARETERRKGQGKGLRNLGDPGEAGVVPEEDYVDIVTGDRFIETIRHRPAHKPLFLHASFCGPHPPYDPPQRFLDAQPLEQRDDFIEAPQRGALTDGQKEHFYKLRRAYRAMLMCIDEQVGRLFSELEQQGIADNTVLLFCSDHGEMLGDRALMGKEKPWRASCTVPAAIRDPRQLVARRIDAPVELPDLTATILDLAGLDAQVALSKPWPAFHDRVPSRSLLPIVRGDVERVREFAFAEGAGWQMIETERWKYVRRRSPEPDVVDESLYDKVADPDEVQDLAAVSQHAQTLQWCRRRRDWVIDHHPPAQLTWAPLSTWDPSHGRTGPGNAGRSL